MSQSAGQPRHSCSICWIKYFITQNAVLNRDFRPHKSRNNTREKNFVFFHVCWYSQPAADTSPAFGATRSGWWMNGKAFTIPNTRVVCRNFLGLWRLKNWKIRIADRQWSSNSSIRGKTNTQKQKPKVTYSMALVLTFFAAENENRQPEDLPLTDFGRLPERLLLSVRTKSINENYVNWKLRPLLSL